MLIEKIQNEKKSMLIEKGKLESVVNSGDLSGLEILA